MALPDADAARGLLRQMLRIRRFEDRCAQLYSAGKIRGFMHLYNGEEAIAVGLIPLLDGQDSLIATYREHGHALARGVDMGTVMAEMYGKQEGCSRGRGGSMHLFDAGTRFYVSAVPKIAPGTRLRASPAARQRAAALGIELATLSGGGPGGAITLSDVEAAPAKQPARTPRASPSVRQRALELGIDLAQITGSGAKGAITVADLARAAANAKPAAPASARPSAAPFEPDAMRRAIAAAMTRSKREIPHYYLATTVDFEPALRFVERINAQRDPEQRLLYAVLLLKALALALKEVPELNDFWR